MDKSIPPIQELAHLLFDEVNCISYLLEKGIFYSERDCDKCGEKMSLYVNRSSFRCMKKNCKREISLKKGSFFSTHRMECSKILLIAYLWLNKMPVTSIVTTVKTGKVQVFCLIKRFRELVSGSLDMEDSKIGGKGIIVEIDEAKLGKRKYNRGHAVEGTWVLGGVERTSERRVFLVQVKDRKADLLTYIINKHVKKGSIVYTDLWKGYGRLKDNGYVHFTVNHSQNFKDPMTGTHTNNIEGTWNALKMQIKPRCRTKSAINDHLWEFIWRRKNADRLWDAFIEALADAYYE